MNFPLLTKLLVSFCAVGGGSVGAFVASNPFGWNKVSEPTEGSEANEVSSGGNSEEKDLVVSREEGGDHSDSSEESVIKQNQEKSEKDRHIVAEDKSEEIPSAEAQELEAPQQIQPEETETLVEKVPLNEPEIEFESEEIKKLLGDSSGSVEEDHLEEMEAQGELRRLEESKEKFRSFDFYEEELSYGELSVDESLTVAEYIRKGEGSNGPICETWMRGVGRNIKLPAKDRKTCEESLKGKSWGKNGELQPRIWLDVDKGQAKRILESYELLKSSSTFNERGNLWDTGPWGCVRESSVDGDNFLISCEYYLGRENRNN
ncbi:hypothetical protein [Mycoplasma suis]|uniref:Uncharacterized protein n=1 Tax=Mycoplasma suis (strain Illinois) TaxID=768700 RepID=F0QQL4_MYCSL|nr:hypothetical protein [Mycoplasma suis]ADX97784.1 hypothetical protein MSU_0240 [Mycoplasma suis str. Illinois]